MGSIIQALVKNKTPWQEDLYITLRFGRQKLSKYYAAVTPTMGMLVISTHIVDPFRKLRSFRNSDKGIDIDPVPETLYTTQYQALFLMYVEIEYRTNHGGSPMIKHKRLLSNTDFSSAIAAVSGQSSYDAYDLSNDDDEYLKLKSVAEPTPGQIDRASRLLTAIRIHLYSPPELPPTWGQMNANINGYNCDPMGISGRFTIPHISDWWGQQEETHSHYADLCNMAHDIFPFIPNGM